MIEFRNITLRTRRQTLLEAAYLHLGKGEKVVLRGVSGCGKSALLKAAVGVMPLAHGSVCVEGMDLSASTVALIRSRIAFIGQEPVPGADRVREVLMLPFTFKAHRHNCPDDEEIRALLNRLHLPPNILEKRCVCISGGEKQRIAVVRALLLQKTIFLADEVTSALDPESRDAVMDELFKPGITLLSASHDPEWIGRSTRVIDIRDRKLLERAE